MNKEQEERYSRQLLLQGFGAAAQEKLLKARVLVIGAGGLGCPVLQYLAAGGAGTIGIVDGDRISLSNLQRQVLYRAGDIGKYKTAVAADRLGQMNPGIRIEAYTVFIDTQNALDLLRGYDVVVDGTDNFAARYLINDACVLLQKPLVFGAVYQYEGQVAVFNAAGNGRSVNYRHLFPVPPAPEEVPDCAAAGVLGVLPGLIGMMQATEAIKLLTGVGTPLKDRMLTYNALTNESYIIDLLAAGGSTVNMPQSKEAFEKMNYETFCRPALNEVTQIDAAAFNKYLEDEGVLIIDVREGGEKPLARFRHTPIPMSVFQDRLHEIDAEEVVFFCQSGMRSLKAAEMLKAFSEEPKKIYNLRGGILSL